MNTGFLGLAVATVLTVYGIETETNHLFFCKFFHVATVLTVYGIETDIPFCINNKYISCNSTYRLRY